MSQAFNSSPEGNPEPAKNKKVRLNGLTFSPENPNVYRKLLAALLLTQPT